ncbi:MAG: hypothetical protein ACLPQS_14465 [Acidimicrobiales bacterium]
MAMWPQDDTGTRARDAAADARNAQIARRRKLKAWLLGAVGLSAAGGLALILKGGASVGVNGPSSASNATESIGIALVLLALVLALTVLVLAMRWSRNERVSPDFLDDPELKPRARITVLPFSRGYLAGNNVPVVPRSGNALDTYASPEDIKLDAIANESSGDGRPEDTA